MDAKLAASLSDFAVRFCNEQEKDRSSVGSPLSAQAVLALTALGCAGASRAELLRAMDLPDDDAIRSTFSFVTSTIRALEGVTLRIANRVYVTKYGTLKPAFQKDAEEVFDSGLEQLDFTEVEAAAARVNKWVAEQTDDMIENVISPDSIVEGTRLILVNAVYFQGFWEFKFSEELTKERTFHVNNATEIQVPTMSKNGGVYYYKHSPDLKAKASLVIVLPDEVEGLNDVMRQLAAGHHLMHEVAGLKGDKVDVMIPKFKVETTIDLKELLPKMGIKSIFDKKASDNRMLTSNEHLYVSQAVQKAVIEVDEAGTIAAAATYARRRPMSARPRPKNPKFFANRPFLFLLMAQQIPLFLGIYQGSKFAVPATLASGKAVNLPD